MIPEELRNEVHQCRAQVAYRDGTNATAAADFDVYWDELAKHQASKQPLGLPTGQHDLDKMLGGLRGLTVIAGEKSAGKTSLALSMMIAALRETPNLAGLIYSLDMPKSRIYSWLICHAANVSFKSLRKDTLTPEENGRVEAAKKRLQSELLPRLRVVGRPTRLNREVFTPSRIHKDLTNLKKATGTSRVLTVIDLFHLMDVPGDIATENERNEFRFETLRSFSDPDRFPVIVLSKVRKAHAERKVLTTDDLYGSVDLSFQADNVLLMWQHSSDQSAGTAATVVRIAKARDAELADVKLTFHYQSHRFSCPKRGKRPPASTEARAKKKSQQTRVDPLAGS